MTGAEHFFGNGIFVKSKDGFTVCILPAVILWDPWFGEIYLSCSEGSWIFFKGSLNADKSYETPDQQEGRHSWGRKAGDGSREEMNANFHTRRHCTQCLPPRPGKQLSHCDLILAIDFLSYLHVFYIPFSIEFFPSTAFYTCSVAKSCVNLCGPMDPPGFSVHGIFQARMLERVVISFSRASSPPTY